jgi:hypothetical protein
MSRLKLAVALLASALAAVGTAAPEPNAAPADEQERLLARGKKFVEEGKIDLFLAVTAAWKLKPGDRRMWEPAVDFGRKLIDRADMADSDRKPAYNPSGYKDYDAYLNNLQPEFKVTDEKYVRPNPAEAVPPRPSINEAIQASGVEGPTGISNCLILSRGSVKVERSIQHSVVFANGDVTARTHMHSAVIVCDGDVTVTEDIGKCVIVARGNIKARGGAAELALIAGGKIALGNRETRKTKTQARDIILDNKPVNTLGVTFFELATVGVEVAVVEKAVRVGAVAAGKPCAKAGWESGDVVLAVNGKTPTDAESLRVLLRDALALGDATVKLKRGDKTETVTVALPE